MSSLVLVRPRLTRFWLDAAVVVAVGLNLRPALTGLAPMLPEIVRDTGLGASGASLLGALPVLCLGLFALAGPAASRRLGLEGGIKLVLAVLALGSALRGAGGSAPLFAGSLLAGAAIGLGNVLVPALLKRDFPAAAGLMSGLYASAIAFGAATAAAVAVPVQRASGGSWGASLALWAVPALAALALAASVWRGRAGQPIGPAMEAAAVPLLRRPLAWQVTLFMGLQSMLAYAIFAWLAPMLRSRGDDARLAGLVVALSIFGQMAASLPVPILAARLRRQSGLAAALMLVLAASYLGLVEAPLGWQWLLAITLGLGSGGAFALAITMILLRSGGGAMAARLSSMSQGVGYTLAAFGPLLIGVLHDRTGDWRGAEVVFVLVGLAAAVAGALAGRPRVL